MTEYSLVRDGSIMRRRLCRDCRRPVQEIGHYYCVEDAVWRASGLPPNGGCLCLSCLEQRLGRLLRYKDFKVTHPGGLAFWDGKERMLPRAWTEYLLARQGL
jgi:hypothetical protein